MSKQPSESDEATIGGYFYRCMGGCGLRFPVAPRDAFSGVCPHCRAAVQLVAHINGPETTAGRPLPSAGDTPLSTVPVSNIQLLLDNWRSIFNVGAAFRSADGAGVRRLYLCGISATPSSHPKVAKTALGAEAKVAWSYAPDAVVCAGELQRQGAALWVLERTANARALFDINILPQDRPVILAAGNEVVGVDPGLVTMADEVVQVPMMGSKLSLNVAVALSIATYWLRAQELKANAGEPILQTEGLSVEVGKL